QRENEKNARNKIGEGRDVGPHRFSFLLYMASIRLVTRNPPKMFTQASTRAQKPRTFDVQELPPRATTDTAISAPTTITEEMALVTLMSGVCSAGVTLHTTK